LGLEGVKLKGEVPVGLIAIDDEGRLDGNGRLLNEDKVGGSAMDARNGFALPVVCGYSEL